MAADHDHSYKLLFAHPTMVQDLLRGFVGGDWLQELDFSTLERVSESYVSDDLRARADDIVWRVRSGERHIYLLVEFQSGIDPFMSVRVLTYVGLLYQDLIRAREVSRDDGLPVILPIVLYNGSSRWRAAQELASLLQDSPNGFAKYRPTMRYLLIDEGAYDDSELASHGNLVSLLFRLENCLQFEQVEKLVHTLVERLRHSGEDGLCRAFAVWLDNVLLARLSGGRTKTVNDLWEKHAMLSERFDVWEQEFRQQGRQEGRQEGESILLTRLVQKRFGELPDSVRERLRDAQPHQLEHWAERLLEVSSLGDLFGTESTASPSSAN